MGIISPVPGNALYSLRAGIVLHSLNGALFKLLLSIKTYFASPE